MKDFAERFYKSKAWQRNRDAYADSVHGLCEDCLDLGEIVPGEIVHHLEELTPENINDPTVTMAWSNLRLVCRDHHAVRHKKKRSRRYTVDASGRIRLRDIAPLSGILGDLPGDRCVGVGIPLARGKGGVRSGQEEERNADIGGSERT